MDWLAHALRRGADLVIRLFEPMGPVVCVTAVSVITGALMLLVIKWTSPQRRVERARSQIAAAIYEVRLFLDSPLRVVKAQGRLLGNSAIYIGALLPAMVVMSLPMGLLYLQLDLRHGFEPAPVGEPVVVEVAIDGELPATVAIDPADWGQVTAPPVRDPAGGSVYFRLQVGEPGAHIMKVIAGDQAIDKRVVAGVDAAVSPERVRGAAMWWAATAESPIGAGAIRAVRIDHRGARRDLLGVPWWLLWLILATAAAFALRRPMRVVL